MRRLADHLGIVIVFLDEVDSVSMICHIFSTVLSDGSGFSLTAAPNNDVRAVIVIMSGIDILRTFLNVIARATSNPVTGIDENFIDRAEILIKVGLQVVAVIRCIISQIVGDLL